MNSFVDAKSLGFTKLSHQLPNGLLLTEQHTKVHFLICNSSERFAVCLELGSGFPAFELDAVNDAWYGCFVSEVLLQVDISSASTSNQRDVRPGDLVISNGGIFIASRRVQMGHGPRLIRWGDSATLGDGTLEGGFTRWRVVRKEDKLVVVLKEINSEA